MATVHEKRESERLDSPSPLLRRVRIRGYKSIAFCDFDKLYRQLETRAQPSQP